MTDLIGQRLGDFEIVREIGRGGMGVVYEARQVSLNRRVALKVLSGGLGLTSKAVQRFRREAEAAAKLHHTNIVPVYATGEADGTHFYAMELIDGPSLDHVIRQLRDGPGADTRTGPPADADPTGPYVPADPTPPPSSSGARSSAERFDRGAAMIADVADALHHAHQQGVTHRDVKPSNLLLSSDGRLSVTDFGLARVLEQPGMTVTGEFVGTPAYMSPEQVTAGRIPVNHRTDVYSLGATLYELLTLRPPFQADGRDKLLAMVVQKEPAAPRSIDPKVPRDLETICLKCLNKDPDQRYQTAKELADDLRRYVNRFAILARRAGPVARLRKWVKRNPVPTALLGALLLALLAAGLFALHAKRTADRLREAERQAAVERAIIEAMGGDAEAGLRSIAQAEQLGAEPGQLNMLRGLVELNRGRVKEAMVHLELAEKQWPDSVAVKALLANAYLADTQDMRYEEMTLLAERPGPKTPEDFLFLGEAQAVIDSRKGLETLDRAPARVRQSPVGRLTRAIIQTWYAQETGRTEDADRALTDIDRVGLPDNPLLMNMQVQALLAAGNAAGPDRAARDAYWKRAGAVAAQLARFPDLPTAIQGRSLYYYVTGDDDALLETVRQGKRRVERSGAFADYEWEVLYRRKKFDEALAALEAAPGPDAVGERLHRAVVLLTLGRVAEAERLMLDALDTARRVPSVGAVPGYFYLLGPGGRTDPRQAADDFLNQSPLLVPDWRGGWYRHLLRYNAGRIDAAELLANAGASRSNQCEGYFYIGLHRLHEGKRAEAKACFAKSVGTGVFAYDEYMWSHAFLACIDDPAWMPWVPPEK
jgi:tetratricopeptide (TPR) repeat protein